MKPVFMFLTVIPLTSASCLFGFTKTAKGCFRVSFSSDRKNWNDAETECQLFGSHVHLATIDTQQVYMCSERVLDV